MQYQTPSPTETVEAAVSWPPVRETSHLSSGGLTAVSHAVRRFFTTELQARETRITKIAAVAGTEAGWEVEVEILLPDLAIKTLGLPLTQEVLERHRYAVRLNPSLDVTGYEPLDLDC